MATKKTPAKKTPAKKTVAEVPSEESTIDLRRISHEVISVGIVGVTPLIVHNWDQKTKDMLPGGKDYQRGKSKAVPKTPEEEYQASRYILDEERDGFPANAFKIAMIDSYFLFSGLKKTQLKRVLFVEGEGRDQLVAIQGERSKLETVVRIGMGTANLRNRAIYEEWKMDLQITYNPSHISAASVVALLDAAGDGGVGEW